MERESRSQDGIGLAPIIVRFAVSRVEIEFGQVVAMLVVAVLFEREFRGREG